MVKDFDFFFDQVFPLQICVKRKNRGQTQIFLHIVYTRTSRADCII